MTSSNSSSFEQYPYPSTLNVANFVSTKLSDSNYGRWKTQMVGLLESQDLLGFIDGTNMAPDKKISVSTTEIENPDYLLWRRTDRLIKGWIIGSLSEEVLDLVVGLNTARDVWAKLENKLVQLQDFLEQVQPERERVQADETEETDLSMYLPLHKAILNDDWKGAQEFFNEHRDRVTAKITPNSYTALHVAVAKGNSNDFVSKLVEMMTREDLALQNNRGNTALVVAACVGNTQAAEILVDKNSDLPHIQNNFGFLPIHYAAANANKDMLRYLQTVAEKNVRVRPNPFEEECGIQLLIDVIVSGLLDVALDLIHRYPHWATLKLENGDTPLKAIARKASAFLSGSHLNFWERLIYSGIPVKLNNHPDDSNGRGIDSPARSSLALMQKCDWVQLHGGHYFNTAYQKLTLAVCRVSGLLVPSSIKHIQDKKLIHYQALELVKSLCKSIGSRKNRHDSDRSHYEIPVMLAASLGIHEVVEEIVDIFPNAAWSQNEDNHTIFDIAVIQRCEKIFNLIYQMNEHKHYLTTPLLPDKFGNTILHLAGRLAPFHKLNRVSGATLQMQRELQWFKEVEKYVKPAYKEMKNSANETPQMVFTKEHKNLMIEGEKLMKDTASSCTIVASLITTVVFAAVINVPGGNNPESGLPILAKQKAFIIFVVSDAVSLFTSTASVLMFLSILTSRYAEEDFLHVLPKRLIIGLVTVFISITFMMISFGARLHLMFDRRSALTLVPVAALACLPVSLFAFLQFPLLVDVIFSTYGPGLFKKQSDRPFY